MLALPCTLPGALHPTLAYQPFRTFARQTCHPCMRRTCLPTLGWPQAKALHRTH